VRVRARKPTSDMPSSRTHSRCHSISQGIYLILPMGDKAVAIGFHELKGRRNPAWSGDLRIEALDDLGPHQAPMQNSVQRTAPIRSVEHQD
jgi:hypothetical protein